MKRLIKDIGDGKRKLAKVIKDYETGTLTSQKFRDLVYGISKYIDAVYKYEVEEKLIELEERVIQ